MVHGAGADSADSFPFVPFIFDVAFFGVAGLGSFIISGKDRLDDFDGLDFCDLES